MTWESSEVTHSRSHRSSLRRQHQQQQHQQQQHYGGSSYWQNLQQQQQQQQQQKYHHWSFQPPPHHPRMGRHDDPRPSTSSGATAPKRTDTAMTTAPLTDQEYNALTSQLDSQGVGDSTINRLLEPGQGASQAIQSWSFDSQELGGLANSDTLERNPGFVNPNQISKAAGETDDGGGEGSSSSSPLVQQQHQNPLAVVKMEQTPQHQIFYTGPVEASGHNYVTVVETTPFELEQLQAVQLPPQTAAVQLQPAQQPQQPPTCSNPTHDAWPGGHDFQIKFLQYGQSTKNKAWDFSDALNKLFIDMGKYVQVGFSAGSSPPDGLLIRALPVYAEAAYLKDPVKRCPNHASLSDASNKGFPKDFVEHLIRVNHDAVVYDEDQSSGRLSVVVPFEQPQVGTTFCTHLIKFMCLGSDVGGINRRPVRVIFTLENESREVVGRQSVDVRICSCPKRDRQQEESRAQVVRNRAQQLAEGIARSNSVFTKPSAKRKKTEVEEFVMVPVAKADFEKINEFAEAAVCMRNPDKAKELKEQRRKLLDMHNRKYLNKPTAK